MSSFEPFSLYHLRWFTNMWKRCQCCNSLHLWYWIWIIRSYGCKSIWNSFLKHNNNTFNKKCYSHIKRFGYLSQWICLSIFLVTTNCSSPANLETKISRSSCICSSFPFFLSQVGAVAGKDNSKPHFLRFSGRDSDSYFLKLSAYMKPSNF